MQITLENTGGATIISLTGRLDELATAEVDQAFTRTLNEDKGGIIVDLSGVEYISSSGLRILLMLSRAVKKQDRDLRLCNLSPFVAEVFEISNFSAMFDIYNDIAVARQGFGNGPS